MATAISLVRKALFLNGCSSEINPASPELIELAFEALIDMLVEWASLNINLGITLPENQTDELDNPPDTNQVIQHQLAVLSAPIFQKEASLTVRNKAATLFTYLLTTYSPHPLPEFPDTLPVGSGNMRGTKPRTFFPTPEALTDTAGVPLVGGSGS